MLYRGDDVLKITLFCKKCGLFLKLPEKKIQDYDLPAEMKNWSWALVSGEIICDKCLPAFQAENRIKKSA